MNATHCLSPEEVLAGSLTSRAPAFLLGGGVSMLEDVATRDLSGVRRVLVRARDTSLKRGLCGAERV